MRHNRAKSQRWLILVIMMGCVKPYCLVLQVPLEALIDRVRELGAIGEVTVSFLSRTRIVNACKNHPNMRITPDDEGRSGTVSLVDVTDKTHAPLMNDKDPVIVRLIEQFLDATVK